ncbi:hypothetical protein ABKV19_013912 [Rosa sericea]
MASAPLIHVRCGYSPRFSCSSNRRNGALGSSPPSSCCSYLYLAFSAGAYNSWKNQGLSSSYDQSGEFCFFLQRCCECREEAWSSSRTCLWHIGEVLCLVKT